MNTLFKLSELPFRLMQIALCKTNLIQVVIIRKTEGTMYTRTHTVLKRVTIGYKIKPFYDNVTNHCSDKFLFCEVSVKMIKPGIHFAIN